MSLRREFIKKKVLQTASDDGSAAAAAFVRHDSVSGCGVLLDFFFFFASSEELELKTLRTAAASGHGDTVLADERPVLLNCPCYFTTEFNEVVPISGFLPVEFWWINALTDGNRTCQVQL